MHSPERLPVLDGLRAISILLVLAAHMLPLGPKVLQLNSTAGPMGMSLFFSLSGFLIASTLIGNPNIYEFIVRRLTRIVPLAYAYLFFVFTIMSFDPDKLFWTAAFLANYSPAHLNGYNAHFWSLCVEIHFYLAIALAVLIGGQRAVWLVWPACLAITALRVTSGAYIEIPTHLRADEILVGACVATLYRPAWKGRMPFPSVLVGLAAVLWFASASPYTEWCQYLRPYATALLLACVLSHDDTCLARILASRVMRYVAAISYALYVLHPLTVLGWWNQGGVLERYLLKRPISFLVTFIAAHISTFYWERFWLDAGRQWIKRRRIRPLGSVT
jgi:peptidoglycan/LPS O-acetylase OafA/YrhL